MLRKRQVHLDFHTSEFVTVGDKFNKEQFQSALKAGHIDSITVFSSYINQPLQYNALSQIFLLRSRLTFLSVHFPMN